MLLEIKKVADISIRNPLHQVFTICYDVNAAIIPKKEANIKMHFQQFSLFISVCFISAKIQENDVIYC